MRRSSVFLIVATVVMGCSSGGSRRGDAVSASDDSADGHTDGSDGLDGSDGTEPGNDGGEGDTFDDLTCDGSIDHFSYGLNPGEDLRRITLPFGDSRCADGSPGVIWVRPGNTPEGESADWLIVLQDGPVCTDAESCRALWCSDDRGMLTSQDAPMTGSLAGIGGGDAGATFSDAALVFVKNCSADAFLGNDSRPVYPDGDGGLELTRAGHTIIERVVDHLWLGPGGDDNMGAMSDDNEITMPEFRWARRIIVVGRGAGGLGALQHIDWFVERTAENDAKPTLIVDNALAPAAADLPSPIANARINARIASVKARTEAGEKLWADVSCLAAKGDLAPCLYSDRVLLDHVTSPFFVRGDLLVPTGHPPRAELDESELTPALHDTYGRIEDLRKTAAEGSAFAGRPAVFATACGREDGLLTDAGFVNDQLNVPGSGTTFRGALNLWFNGQQVGIDPGDGSRSTCQ